METRKQYTFDELVACAEAIEAVSPDIIRHALVNYTRAALRYRYSVADYLIRRHLLDIAREVAEDATEDHAHSIRTLQASESALSESAWRDLLMRNSYLRITQFSESTAYTAVIGKDALTHPGELLCELLVMRDDMGDPSHCEFKIIDVNPEVDALNGDRDILRKTLYVRNGEQE